MSLKHGSLLLLLYCIPFVILLQYQKPVAEKLWRQRCVRNSHVLNDCNWCRCSANFKYICDARVCGEVDMFGHFNDAIQDIDVGMEGHGVWRTTPAACEPGVHYQRGALLCICTEDSTWPNPVCRDSFRVLHPVEVINDFKLSKAQKCSPTKLYLVDCNVCFCPSTGHIDPSLCTNKKCTKSNLSTRSNDQIDEVYAQCDVNKQYKLGCQSCLCLKNNRLQCDSCTKESQCKGKIPGENFNIDCNTCHCDDKGTLYCTVNRCLDSREEISILKYSQYKFQSTRRPINDIDCEPGTKFEKDCNTCYCFLKKGNIKKYGCTIKKCHREDSEEECKIGVKFTKDCELCHCSVYKGNKIKICQSDPKCDKRYHRESLRHRVYYVQRDCEPLQIYENDCNTCQCLQDGRTLTCTDEPCDEKPISIDLVPIAVKSFHCPQEKSYKIDCNFCVCLQNGNAFCTTMDCRIQN